MNRYRELFWEYVRRITAPNLAFLGAFSAAYFLVHVVFPHFFDSAILAALAIGSFAYLSHLADSRTLLVVPTFFATKEERQNARAIKGGLTLAVGLFGFLSPTSPVAMFVLITGVKFIAVTVFAVLAFEEFRANVYPVLRQHEGDEDAFEIEMASRVDLVAAERSQASAQVRAVMTARAKVFDFYAIHQKILRPVVDEAWVYAQVRADIPDETSDQQAFAGAAKILATLDEHLKAAVAKAEEDRRRKDVRQQELDRQLRLIQEEIAKVRGSSTMDPDIRQAELAALEQQRRRLQSQKT